MLNYLDRIAELRNEIKFLRSEIERIEDEYYLVLNDCLPILRAKGYADYKGQKMIRLSGLEKLRNEIYWKIMYKRDELENLQNKYRNSRPRTDYYGPMDEIDILIKIKNDGSISGHLL